MSGAGLGLRLHDLLYRTSHHDVFERWWTQTARGKYLGFTDGDAGPEVTLYYDPIIGYHHRVPVRFGGTWPAFYLATQKRDDARAVFDAALAQAGLLEVRGPIALPRPPRDGHHAPSPREWGIRDLADALQHAADERYEPTWDRERGEFTWSFGFNEEHPRGQYNATMAAAEAVTEGAWWRLGNAGPGVRFEEPTVSGVDFPDVTLTQAWWDAGRERLVVATAPRNDNLVGRPTTFRVANLGDASRWSVRVDDGVPVSMSAAGGTLEVTTTIGTHRFVVFPRA